MGNRDKDFYVDDDLTVPCTCRNSCLDDCNGECGCEACQMASKNNYELNWE